LQQERLRWEKQNEEWMKHAGEVHAQLYQRETELLKREAHLAKWELDLNKAEKALDEAGRREGERECERERLQRQCELDLERTERALQKEKANSMEQYKRVKKLERQGKRREERIGKAQQHFQQQANEHFSVIYTTLQLGLKAQPSPPQSSTTVFQADVRPKASARHISSKEPLPLRLPLPRESLASLHPQPPMPRTTAPPSKRPASLLMFGKPSSRPSSSSPSPKLDSSLNVPECPVSVNHSVTFPAPPLALSLSKEEKVIDATSVSHPNIAPSTAPSLVPLSVKQQQDSEVVATSSVGPAHGNDTCRMRCPALPVLKEGKMIDVSAVHCQVLNPPGPATKVNTFVICHWTPVTPKWQRHHLSSSRFCYCLSSYISMRLYQLLLSSNKLDKTLKHQSIFENIHI
jgi:hypothetical protein